MFLSLSKILPLFVYPLGLSILLVLLGLLLLLARGRGAASLLLLTSVALLWAASTPALSTWLEMGIQNRYPPRSVEELAAADCAIVLGGIMGQATPPRVRSELSGSVDRILLASRVFRQGKAGKIVVAAGNLPWITATQPEAELIRDLLVEWGVPTEAILLDTESRNSRENAVNARKLMEREGLHSAFLITSANHMPRALAVFHRVGIMAVLPLSTDVAVPIRTDTVFAWLPDAGALEQSTAVIKEYVGLLVYRIQGWI